jgi:hypothetical protein
LLRLVLLWKGMHRSIAASIVLALIIVVLKAQIFYGNRYSVGPRSLMRKMLEEWDILSFIGLVTVIYIALEIIVRLVRARTAN